MILNFKHNRVRTYRFPMWWAILGEEEEGYCIYSAHGKK